MTSDVDVSGLVFTKEYARKLYQYSGTPEELRNILYPVFKSQYSSSRAFPERYMDPFTAIAIIHRGSKPGLFPRKSAICEQLKNIFDMKSPIPNTVDAIPTFDLRQTTFTTQDELDVKINKLWDCFRIFYDYSQNKIGDEQFIDAFNECIDLDRVGCSRISTALFWIDYEFYISLDSPNLNYLKNRDILISTEDMDGRAYIDVLKKVKTYLKTSGISSEQMSLEAWKEWNDRMVSNPPGDWWPPDDYDPDISEEKWVELLHDREVFNIERLHYLKAIYSLGGECTLKQLAQRYGKTVSYYLSIMKASIDKISEKVDVFKITDGNTERNFPIMFYGKASKSKSDGTYVYRMRPELKGAVQQCSDIFDGVDLDMYKKDGEKTPENVKNFKLNTIFYGPPGTGKTYNTFRRAVEIIDGKVSDDFKEVKKRYEQLSSEGRIGFITFHQSYSYEEFIEGLKPSMEDNEDSAEVRYSVEPGVFKIFCDNARSKPSEVNETTPLINPTVWKVSLKGTGKNDIRDDCLQHGYIRLGFNEYGDIEDLDSVTYGKNVLKSFINQMKVGDIVVSCFSASQTDAIGVITGEYEYRNNVEDFNRFREVKWLKTFNPPCDIRSLNNGKSMTLSTVYRLKIPLKSIYDLIGNVDKTDPGKYVFIIDEINRGNVSRIFGELITLLESSKREGMSEALSVTLPYSKNPFSIPSNVYILGTMNTADRSLVSMDAALRRRFSFEEMMPKPSLLKEVDGINLEELLKTINLRIESLYDREHTIGHSYLMDIDDIEGIKDAFKECIIPLIQEYFFDDYERIFQVLSRKDDPSTSDFIDKSDSAIEGGHPIYSIKQSNYWDFKRLYEAKADDNST